MRSIFVDKVASVAQHSDLSHELRLSADIPCEEGVLIAVRVLNNKTRYNQLELTSGRMATVNQDDIVVGALGHRKALLGYSGHLPQQLEIGATIQLLNIGGVLGICDSANPDVGAPFDCEVLGTVLHFPYLGERIGVPARVGAKALETNARLDTRGIPIIALAGTCMDSGKTAAACAIVSRLRHRGMKVSACKATGVSLRRDILAMEDAGAANSMIFSDLEAKLADKEIHDAFTAVILCANDPVAAWGGVKILREQFDMDPAIVTGPVTDNTVGIDQIRDRLSLPAINALNNGVALGDYVADLLIDTKGSKP